MLNLQFTRLAPSSFCTSNYPLHMYTLSIKLERSGSFKLPCITIINVGIDIRRCWQSKPLPPDGRHNLRRPTTNLRPQRFLPLICPRQYTLLTQPETHGHH